MANLDHRTLSSSNVHEPKHITNSVTADTGKVITASSSSSGTSEFRLLTPDDLDVSGGVTNISLAMNAQTVLYGSSTLASQGPSALGTPHQVTFGPAQGTGVDPVMLDAAGVLTINEDGLYIISTFLQFGRTGGAGVALLLGRNRINGTPGAASTAIKLVNADVLVPFRDKTIVFLPAGTQLTLEIIRDSTGNNSGGLFRTTSADGWNAAACAELVVQRFI